MRIGCAQVYTGDGKGKTTAAVGLAVRAAGAGLSGFFAQFMKEGNSSEIGPLRGLAPLVELRHFGRGRFITGKPDAEDIRMAREGLDEARRILVEARHDVVILDEANVAAFFHLFEVEDLLELIELRPPSVELVLTGRRADPRVIERADLVTEMRAVKHYHDRGVAARRGIED
jgi:cob(I)alamin adenosyltransferase